MGPLQGLGFFSISILLFVSCIKIIGGSTSTNLFYSYFDGGAYINSEYSFLKNRSSYRRSHLPSTSPSLEEEDCRVWVTKYSEEILELGRSGRRQWIGLRG
uniref:Uncharacterized protein n=1 Tax=Nelumbo nucifera TaxID=4432 RepID=A0A822XJ54_NELNU|nr:TPA_asm: hypothetical protein HUJ06_021750 [Nelumbo nucifera]